MRVVIEGAQIRDVAGLHRVLAQELDFGPYYGANLSALWDRLSTDVERPVDIVWQDADVSRDRFGPEAFDAIVAVIRRAEEWDVARGHVDRLTLVVE
ncbi:barstar family protein [Kutzneria buriramensis]|uniref:RNAse (Barnase) inhibitor barstar n=1 Tax=Kutzneria buriramensis TaxID=1045776 RepID=A0A3E0HCW9_9PSEU|nr:barstar family protein [Kutzneria buriramensis]REH41829.1 RNAse (barnase) inhibitor barstar [Kutzneria buriramensis]